MPFSDPWPGSALVFHTSSSEHYTPECPKSSAISISQDWVLTHGTALNPIITTCDVISTFVADLVPGQLTKVPEEPAGQMRFSVLREQGTGIKRRTGGVEYAWICPLLERTFDEFFGGWSYYERNTAKLPKSHRSLFLLIRIDTDRKIPTAERALRSLQLRISSRRLTRGTPVEIVSSPFGNMSFINSISQGVISNLIGSIIMTDAYVLPKSEGGPLYAISPDNGSRNLIGMVIVTMIWYRNEWVHYTFAANLAPCLSVILEQNHRSPLSIIPTRHHDNSNALDRGVVTINCGSNKGTGVLVDKDAGIFLTCSHVIEEAHERDITVVTFKGEHYSRVSAKLLFSNPKTLPYDVAVLKVEPSELDPSLEPVQFSDAPIVQGEPVVAVGYAFFLSARPTISNGVVSKSLDCMLVTTCCIQSGFSGGAIISRTTGKMLGMIASNVQSVDNSIYFQRMSLSVPVSVLSKPLRQYLLTGNVDALQPLVSHDSTVQKTWALEYQLPSKL